MKRNIVTAGKEGEPALEKWNACSTAVQKLPDDERGILRISVGGDGDQRIGYYCVFRGDRHKCLKALRKAVAALEARPEEPR